MRLGICGGDARAVHLAMLCHERGHTPLLWNLEGADLLAAWRAAPGARVQALALPAPLTNARGEINAPFGVPMMPWEALAYVEDGGTVVCGGATEALREEAAKRRIRVIDVLREESYLLQNAALTAEAALCMLAARSDIALLRARCAVLGYGRIGRRLLTLLHALGAQAQVYVMDDIEHAAAASYGYDARPIEALEDGIAGLDALFNTIPKRVVTACALGAARPSLLLCELASQPGGFDIAQAQAYGLTAWSEPGLPGRYCPRSAAALFLPYLISSETAKSQM